MRLEVSTSRRQDVISTFTAHSDDGDGRLSAVDLSILQRTTDRSCDVVVLCQRSKRGGSREGCPCRVRARASGSSCFTIGRRLPAETMVRHESWSECM